MILVYLFTLFFFHNSTASLPPVASLVNSSYEAASGNLSEVQQAHQDSEQLLTDVTEAEGMYIRRYFQLCGVFNCCYNLAFQCALNR